MGMRRRLRLLTLVVLAILPGPLKRLGYRVIFGYRIGRGARIGLALLDCRQLTIGENARIGHGTVFWQCGEVAIGREVVIGVFNLFRGGKLIRIGDYGMLLRFNVINAIIEPDFAIRPDSSFILGPGSVITAEHRIDFTDRVEIGQGTILGGRNSSIWTHNRRHGSGVMIGDHCYVGSEIRMAPGSAIPARCIVGLGAVVTSRLESAEQLIAGVPARPLRPLSEQDRELLFDQTRRDLPADLFGESSPRG